MLKVPNWSKLRPRRSFNFSTFFVMKIFTSCYQKIRYNNYGCTNYYQKMGKTNLTQKVMFSEKNFDKICFPRKKIPQEWQLRIRQLKPWQSQTYITKECHWTAFAILVEIKTKTESIPNLIHQAMIPGHLQHIGQKICVIFHLKQIW